MSNHERVIIGITGQTGSGKSDICNYFKKNHNVAIICCDTIAHDIIQQPNIKDALKKEFGNNIFDKNNNIDRKIIGEIIFSDTQKRKTLESHLIPKIKCEIERQLTLIKNNVIFLDAPTLHDHKMDQQCNIVIGICANKTLRKNRIMKRNNLSEDQAEKRINAQPGNEFYEQRCDKIVYNDSDFKDAIQQMKQLLYLGAM